MGFIQFKRIGHRILVTVGSAMILAMVGLLLFFTDHQETSILAQNERTNRLLAQSVSQGLQTVMLSGYADIAQDFAENLKKVKGIVDFRILRMDGREAFRDNQTINTVNRQLGDEAFPPREEDTLLWGLPRNQLKHLRSVFKKNYVSLYETNPDGEKLLTFLAPIANKEACNGCHGGEQAVRGVLKLTTSLAAVEQDIARDRQQAILILIVALLITIVLIYILIHRTVEAPIHEVTEAMTNMAGGDLDQRAPILGKDELADMAQCFNQLGSELKKSYTGLKNEQDKLTTIILSAREGIVVTDADGRVVLVNPAAERLLGKGSEDIVSGGFLFLLDDPEYMRAFLDVSGSDMPETIVYNNRVLNFYASTIGQGRGGVIGSAALIRDITEEKRLEEQLRKLSTTDGLTQLINRRRMDEILEEEYSRAERYGLELSVLLFDVDHFKKFNDTHGHDQGDRVLIALADVMKEHFRDVDSPCRYGGEEFVAILPSTGYAGGLQAAERLREKVEAMVVDGLKVTISIGLAIFPLSTSEGGPEALIKAADEALYQAKGDGRNNVCYQGPKNP